MLKTYPHTEIVSAHGTIEIVVPSSNMNIDLWIRHFDGSKEDVYHSDYFRFTNKGTVVSDHNSNKTDNEVLCILNEYFKNKPQFIEKAYKKVLKIEMEDIRYDINKKQKEWEKLFKKSLMKGIQK